MGYATHLRCTPTHPTTQKLNKSVQYISCQHQISTMASITKRGKSYRVQVRVDNERRTETFKLKAEALAWAMRTEQEMRSGVKAAADHSMLEALRKYAEEVSSKKDGARWEQIRLKKFERSLPFASKPIAHVSAADIALWRDSSMQDADEGGPVSVLAPGSVRREMGLLNSVFEIAVKEWQWISANPMTDVTKPPNPKARNRIFTDDEVDQICEKLTGPIGSLVRAALLLSLETAMRSGEILSLTWDQVDLKRQVAHLLKTKNGDERDVPLSRKAVAIIEGLPKDGAKLFGGLGSGSRDVLFRKARDKCGIEGVTFHDARATAITRLSKLVDILTLARISGHRDLKSLQIYYRESATEIAKRLG